MESLQLQLQQIGLSAETLLLGTVFLTVVLLVVGMSSLFEGRRPLSRRLTPGEPAVTLKPAAVSLPFSGLLNPLQKTLGPKDMQELSTVRQRLARAGFMSPSAVAAYFSIRIGLAIALPVVALVIGPILFDGFNPATILIVLAIGVAAGFYGPALVVRSLISSRQEAARQGFPDALDMLLVCVEAGQSLNAALGRVSQEIGKAHPVLGEQLQLVALEMQAGVPRATALRNLAARLAINDVSSLVTLLLQSEAYGTSIADSLRIHATEMRRMRLLRAEERANRLPVLISLPLMLFILPSLVTVIMTPVIIRVVRILMPALGG